MRTALPSIVAAVIAGLLGCKDGAAPTKKVAPALDAAAAVAVAVDAAPEVTDAMPPPLTPPPPGGRGVQVFDLQYGGFDQPGMPAIKDDGSELAATAVADDGGRGYLDLRFLVIDGATGKVRQTIHVVHPDETTDAINKDDAAGNLDAEDALAVQVRERAARANAVLAAGTWRTLSTIERGDSGPPQPSESLTAGDVTFSYDLGLRRLTVARGGKQVAAHDLAKLLPRRRIRTDDPCPGDLPYLGALHVDEPTRKVLVEMTAWPQGHNCGGNGSVFTVVPLP